tara:strand:+ start:213 stop:524 length:312 start_codon:yes stop_codon:yes gene_type:complete
MQSEELERIVQDWEQGDFISIIHHQTTSGLKRVSGMYQHYERDGGRYGPYVRYFPETTYNRGLQQIRGMGKPIMVRVEKIDHIKRIETKEQVLQRFMELCGQA